MSKIYLTFDDGPSAEYTVTLLETLNKYDVKATFFVLGQFAKENPNIIAEEIKGGHKICLHGNRHICTWLMTKKMFIKEMNEALEIINGMGANPTHYRAPWGMINHYSRKVAAERGMEVIRWDVMAEDWRGTTTAKEIAAKLLTRIKDNSVICLHDGRGRNGAPARTIEALETVIPILLERGFAFEVL